MNTTQHYRKIMQDRLTELENRLHGIDQELDSHQDRDWDDSAIQREDDEVLEGLGHSGQAEIRMIEAALARMDEGEYGFCVRCGDTIQPERLNVLPYTPLCRACAGATARA